MKKLATLLLAAGMVLGSFAGAQAIDFKVKGEFQQDFSLTDGLKFTKRGRDGNSRYGNGAGANDRDNFNANQRVRFQLDAVASESLSGTVFFEIGAADFGRGSAGGTRQAIGTSGRNVAIGVRYAYLDWFVPNTDLKLRMGLQGVALPSFTFAYSPVMNYEGSAVAASYKFNDNASATLFWARPLNDNAAAVNPGLTERFRDAQAAGEKDNFDVFGLIVPLSFDGFKVTPYGLLGMIGPRVADGGFMGDTAYNMRPYYWATNNARGNRGAGALRGEPVTYGTAWWVGLTGEITAADPFRFAWEATYGSVSHPSHGYLNRQGWFLNVLAEYKLDWGVPGIYAWWGSGDNSNPRDGSEKMPLLANHSGDYPMSNFGFNGSWQNGNVDSAGFGNDPTGTWGIGLRLRDVSFLEGLKHTLRVHVMGGTNSPQMAKYMLGKKGGGLWQSSTTADFNSQSLNSARRGMYLTTVDNAVEINLDTSYKIYENLEMVVELGYIHLWLDQSRAVWGGGAGIRGVELTDAVKASVTFMYRF